MGEENTDDEVDERDVEVKGEGDSTNGNGMASCLNRLVCRAAVPWDGMGWDGMGWTLRATRYTPSQRFRATSGVK